MIHRLKTPLLLLCVLACSWWIGTGIFNYFTHANSPVINLEGVEKNGSYARKIDCILSAQNDYKIADVSVMVDDKIILNTRVKSKHFQLPFSVDTSMLDDGQHTLEVTAFDSSYNHNKTTIKSPFIVDNTPLRAAFLSSEYSVDQGKTLHLKIQANKKLADAQTKFLSKTYQFHPQSDDAVIYECFIPIDCEEHVSDHMLTADIQDLVQNKTKLTCKVDIRAFEFKKQKGFTVSHDKLAQEKEISMSEKVLDEALEKWLEQSPRKKLWSGPFEFPIQVQRMTTPFGEVRMTSERGRYMHKGVDLINQPRSVVWAAQDGNVIMKDRFFLTGNTVVIDHGVGIFTLYAHLEEFADIEIGNKIKKGSPVGKLGMTGYATGYHLHWELRVNNTPVDPVEWTSKVF